MVRREMIAYALPVLPIYFLWSPIVILQGVYAKYFGLPLATIAGIILVARLCDAFSDPVVGYLSDRHIEKGGGRKVFVIIGGFLVILSSWFLYVPFESYSPSDSTMVIAQNKISAEYFLFWLLAFYISYTIFEIPHLAWGSRLGICSRDNNRIFSLRALCVILGSLIFFSVPLAPFFDSTEITPQSLKWSVIVAATLMIPCMILCVLVVPEINMDRSAKTVPSCKKGYHQLRDNFRSLFSNKPFNLFILSFFFSGAGIGMWSSMLFLFVETYLGFGAMFSPYYAISLIVGGLSIWLWLHLASYLGKRETWCVALFLTIVGMLTTGLLSPAMPSEILLLSMIFVYVGMTAIIAVAPSLLADIIDYGEWKDGNNHGAKYYSVYTLVTKANVAVGGAAGFAIAGYYGLNAELKYQSAEAVFGLLVASAWLPVVLVGISVFSVISISISERRHMIICKRIGLCQQRDRNAMCGM